MKIKIETQLILDFSLCALFTLISIFFMSLIFPDGIAYKFLLRSSKLIGLIFGLLTITFLVFWYFDKNFQFKKKIDLPELKDFILFSLPISPVIDYALRNTEYLNVNGLLYLLIITFTFIIFFSFIFPILFSYFGSYKILMITGLALSFTILSIAKIASNPNSHIFNSQFVTQGSYLIISFILIYIFYLLNKTAAYTFVFIFMVSGIIINFYNSHSDSSTTVENPERIIKFLNNKDNKINKKKNIYVLVYESYPNLETLDYYGFNNTEQINFLEENGFTIYHGTYSVGASSVASTSRMLEIEGKLSKHGRYYVSGNAFIPKVFKANGYKTIALFKSSFYLDTSSSITWDKYYPKDDVTKIGGKTLTKSIFQGEFKFDIFDEFSNYEEYLKLKEEYLSLNKNNTLFYTHNGYPGHSGNSGVCNYSEEKNKYFEGMEKANKEMKNDIRNIVNNDPSSIIVLVGDHGPYLTKNCRELRNYDITTIDRYDIQDRYGAFLSIYWPRDISDNNHNIVLTQDIFPAILSNITNNKNLFNELKMERRFFDRFNNISGGVNVHNGIIKGGKDNGKPLFNKRTYIIPE